VVDRYRVIDHDPFHCVGPRGVVRDTAQLPHDFDVQHDFAVNPLLVENDLIIATGVVEPHQYAGYSGGGKTAVIGCGSEATIAWTHGPHFLDQPGVRLGRVDGNPFQQFVRQAAEAVGLKFVVNVVLDGEGRPTAVRAGHPIAVQDALVAMARLGHEVQLTQLYDLIITKVDPPKDINLYQASRAATYLGLTATPSLRRGGVMIIEARCPEGPGQGVGEQRFFRSLSEASNLEGLLARFRAEGCLAGEQRAFMLAQVLLNYTVVIAGSECPEAVQACHMLAANSIDEAIALTRDLIGEKANVLHLSHPLHTVPVVVNNV
jgi:nickel-dependent lactate racemase